jgi:UDP-N-acetylglucosamine--N-acetylmuramyl-(pentapeptide) pyrophosphoryl-undecaprenol N-acetylglucosamine transferase
MKKSNLKVIISGGGTGGHIFPALAIANAIRKADEGSEILFIGAKGRMEMKLVPAAGYPIEGLWISGLVRRLTLKNLAFPLKVLVSMMKARRVIKHFGPDAVIGVGGFASGPTLRVAVSKKIPTLIQEQNSYPGITNKILSRHVDRICVAYDSMGRFFPAEKIVVTGNPIRQDILESKATREEALAFFGLAPGKKTVLVVGGSLGARSINMAIENAIPDLLEHQIQLIWQTGKGYYDKAFEATRGQQSGDIKVLDFIGRMDLAYRAADLVVSRAGAIAISELSAMAKPAILVPYPFAAEDHQQKNAMACAERNAAVMVPDQEAGRRLATVIQDLISQPGKLASLGASISTMAHLDSADRIAAEVLKLIEEKTGGH